MSIPYVLVDGGNNRIIFAILCYQASTRPVGLSLNTRSSIERTFPRRKIHDENQNIAHLDIDDVIASCTEQGLPRRYWPERLIQVDGFPRTASGKIRKQQLRDELVNASASTAAADPDGPDRSAA